MVVVCVCVAAGVCLGGGAVVWLLNFSSFFSTPANIQKLETISSRKLLP